MIVFLDKSMVREVFQMKFVPNFTLPKTTPNFCFVSLRLDDGNNNQRKNKNNII